MHRKSLFLVVACLGLGVSVAYCSQEGKEPKEQPEKKEDEKPLPPGAQIQVLPFFNSEAGPKVQAAVAVIGPGGPLTALTARMGISENTPPIDGWYFIFDKALPLNQRYLDAIQDGRPLQDMNRKEVKELKGPDRGFYLALNEAIQRSHSATEEMFANSAEENKTVVYTHLVTEPGRYRGKVINVRGKLALIRRVDAPRLVRDDIPHVYTGFIVGPTKGAPPFTVIFTQLPKDMEVSERLNLEVSFQGYYLGRVLFPAEKDRGVMKKDLVSPYLVGKTLTVHPPAKVLPVEETSYTYYVVVSTLGAITAIAFLVVGLNVWLRRGDRRIQSQLANVRDKHQPFNLEPAETTPPPEPRIIDSDQKNGTANPENGVKTTDHTDGDVTK